MAHTYRHYLSARNDNAHHELINAPYHAWGQFHPTASVTVSDVKLQFEETALTGKHLLTEQTNRTDRVVYPILAIPRTRMQTSPAYAMTPIKPFSEIKAQWLEYKSDLAQDLLVILEKPNTHHTKNIVIHLRTLSSGGRNVYPNVASSDFAIPLKDSEYDTSADLFLADDVIALFLNGGARHRVVFVNWRRGVKFASISEKTCGYKFIDFSFITSRVFMLVAHRRGTLNLFELKSDGITQCLALELPDYGARKRNLSCRAGPTTNAEFSQDSTKPTRIHVVMERFDDGCDDKLHVLSTDGLLNCLNANRGRVGIRLSWDYWAPSITRVLTRRNSELYGRDGLISGSRLALTSTDPITNGPKHEVLDFSPWTNAVVPIVGTSLVAYCAMHSANNVQDDRGLAYRSVVLWSSGRQYESGKTMTTEHLMIDEERLLKLDPVGDSKYDVQVYSF